MWYAFGWIIPVNPVARGVLVNEIFNVLEIGLLALIIWLLWRILRRLRQE
jgi:hypothetical protein